MRKFRNKKLASLLVVFLLVFILSGAFALFQTILDVRGRVNMYAPTIDAIIANLTPVNAPVGWNMTLNEQTGLSVVPDPHGVHTGNNPLVGGPWRGSLDVPVANRTTRFDDRVFLPSLGENISDPAAFANFNERQTVDGVTRLISVAGAVPSCEDQRAIASWAWSWQSTTTDSVDDVLEGVNGGYEGLRPNPNRVVTGTITNPADFRRLYLDLTFDNFSQFYVFELDLANVGAIDLEVDEIRIERVLDTTLPFTAPAVGAPEWSPLDAFRWIGGSAPYHVEHPRWQELSATIEAGLAQLFNITVDTRTAQSSSNDGILLEAPLPGNAGSGAATGQGAITNMRNANNTEYVVLRFCVALENWNAFLAGWDRDDLLATFAQGPFRAEGWGADIVGGFPPEVESWEDALDYLLDYLFNNALSSTFRISYTVIPYQPDIDRYYTGVLWP